MDLHLRGKRVLITGASKGIGAAAAEAFAEEGCDLRLAARNVEQMQALADQWLKAPEFSFGTKQQWDQAAEAASQLRLLRADATKRGIDPATDKKIIDFYVKGGNGNLVQFYTSAGAKNANAISEQRKTLQKSPLWSLVQSTAAKKDHPLAAP